MYPMLLRIRNIVYHQQINNIYRLNALVLRSWVVVLLSGPFHHQTMIAVHIVQVPPSALHLLHVFASAFFICILQNCLCALNVFNQLHGNKLFKALLLRVHVQCKRLKTFSMLTQFCNMFEQVLLEENIAAQYIYVYRSYVRWCWRVEVGEQETSFGCSCE